MILIRQWDAYGLLPIPDRKGNDDGTGQRKTPCRHDKEKGW